MRELIDREYAKEAVKHIPWCDWKAVGECLDACPTIDPESLRPKGEWYWLAYDANPKIGNWHCSVCNRIPKSLKKEDFCPNCGADMRGES